MLVIVYFYYNYIIVRNAREATVSSGKWVVVENSGFRWSSLERDFVVYIPLAAVSSKINNNSTIIMALLCYIHIIRCVQCDGRRRLYRWVDEARNSAERSSKFIRPIWKLKHSFGRIYILLYVSRLRSLTFSFSFLHTISSSPGCCLER